MKELKDHVIIAGARLGTESGERRQEGIPRLCKIVAGAPAHPRDPAHAPVTHRHHPPLLAFLPCVCCSGHVLELTALFPPRHHGHKWPRRDCLLAPLLDPLSRVCCSDLFMP